MNKYEEISDGNTDNVAGKVLCQRMLCLIGKIRKLGRLDHGSFWI